MNAQALDSLAAAVARDPRDLDALATLCRLAERTQRDHEVFSQPRVRSSLHLVWLENPRDPALARRALGQRGLALETRAAPRPGRFWTDSGRLARDGRVAYDRQTGLPLVYRRLLDGARMLLVPAAGVGRRPFLLDQVPVTVGQFRAATGDDPRGLQEVRPASLVSFLAGSHPEDSPVHRVSMGEIGEFLRAAGVDLPTPLEWRFAATAGENLRFPWGAGPPAPPRAHLKARDVALVGGRVEGAGPFGHLDLIGNVAEVTDETWESDSMLSEKAWVTVVGGGFDLPPGRAGVRWSESWRYTRSPTGHPGYGFRPLLRL